MPRAVKPTAIPKYEPTPRDREMMAAYFARKDARKPSPRMTVTNKNGVAEIAVAHPRPDIGQALLMEALGTGDLDFWDGLDPAAGKCRRERHRGRARSELHSRVGQGHRTSDQIEAMLAAQMAAVHNATMTFAGRLNCVDNIPQQDSAERAFNKLARTFAAQVEALKRYRTGGQQKVTVEHVTVNAGGQAIVGSVASPGVGLSPKSEDQSHAITHAPGTAMPSAIKAEREAVPGTGRQRA